MRTLLWRMLMILLSSHAIACALQGMVLQTSNPMFGGGNLVIHYISTGQRTTLQNGTLYGPSFSPDGKKIAYGDQSRGKICIVDIAGNGRTEITSCGSTEPTVTWAGNGYIYFGYNDRNIYRVRPDGTGRGTVFTSNGNIHALGVSQDGNHAAWTKPAWSVAVVDIGSGVERNFGGGCQGSVSPDGQLVTHNLGGHTRAEIKRWDGSVLKSIYTPEGTFNLHRWAHNSHDYVCYTIEGSNKGYIHNVTTDQRTYIGSGICWDYFPQELQAGPATPDMRLSQTTVNFAGELGGTATPSSAVVNVTNGTAGTTLDAVTVSGAPSWLTVTLGGSGNAQALTNQVNMQAVSAEGTFSATITVRANNANPQTRTYTATLTVQSAPMLTSIRITPSTAAVQPNGSVRFSAEALDQYGTALAQQPAFAWEALGGGTIDASGVFTAGSQEGGPFEVQASASGKTGTATVTIAEIPPIHLKLNCGGSGVAGWDSEVPYLVAGQTGSAYDFGSAPSTGSVVNAAPAEVYRTVRNANHAYSFGDIPNGTYIVRFHFYDAYAGSDRSMDYTVEGVLVIDNLCIATAAGGAAVLVREFEVTVSDGNGLQIVCGKDQGNDVFEAGIEIISKPPVVQPAIVVTAPAQSRSYRQGDTVLVGWSADCGSVPGVKVDATLDDGENWTVIEASGSLDCGEQTWTWSIPESLTVAGVRRSTVSATCQIRVSNYMGSGEALSALFSIERSDMTVGAMRHPHTSLAPLRVHAMPEGGVSVSVNTVSMHTVDICALDGRQLWRRQGDGPRAYRVAVPASRQVLLITLREHSGARHVTQVIVP
jgi:hypothetical protein